MPYKFDAAKLTKDHKIVAVATLVLFISLFLPWFGVGGYLGVGFSFTVDGLYHGYMYITLILCLAVLGLLALVAGMDELPFKLPVPEAQALLGATGLNALLTVISFLTKPGGTSWKFGAYVGLIAALIAVAPKVLPALAARRASKGTTTVS